MRSRSIISDSGSSARINVTPMIDVVMVLIVFYLLVGQLAIDRRASILLPTSQTGIDETIDQDPIVVSITQSGQVSINGIEINSERFEGEIQGMYQRSPSTPIRVRAHRDATYGVVRPVIDSMRDSGISRIELVTEASS